MDLGLRGKVALVTGASRGIGAATAAQLGREGCTAILVARETATLEPHAAAIRAAGGKAAAFAADLRDAAAGAALLQAVRREFGDIAILVANAGSARMGHFLELSDAEWDEGFALKFFGHMRLIRSAWPQLKASRGSVVFIAGFAGRTPAANTGVLGAVNAALHNLTKTLACLGVDDGVTVNAINPGATRTERYYRQIHEAAERLGKSDQEIEDLRAAERGNTPLGEPNEVADLVCFLASKRGRHLQGTIIDIDGGKTKTL